MDVPAPVRSFIRAFCLDLDQSPFEDQIGRIIDRYPQDNLRALKKALEIVLQRNPSEHELDVLWRANNDCCYICGPNAVHNLFHLGIDICNTKIATLPKERKVHSKPHRL